ncbi:MAG TPA: zinc-dependent alcohol dehydrogenase [Solirubrobacteraceae bacterium]|jgi:threonine dehydrogenase-like Zn-dependent dehydrogenase|nr:zinc-dependent alcohol dehydrogenase [Solirubrobacteraceae bacterium]
MRALTWRGVSDVRVDTVPDPTIQQPDDIIVRITSTGLCGSDLHLYTVLAPYLDAGDVLGHEPMGIVEEIGPGVTELGVGDRVVIPFNVSCGDCWMCGHGLHSQCETTQVHEYGTGASLFGYTKLYGQIPGGQAELLRVPFGNFLPIKVPHGPPDDRFVFLSDVLPTAWQGVAYAEVPDGGTLVVLGLGPIGDMAARIARHQGRRVIGVDLVPERLARVRALGIEVLDLTEHDDLAGTIRETTDGRGPDAVLDAVGMEAHGSPAAGVAHKLAGLLPDKVGQTVMEKAGVSKLAALLSAIEIVRRGGTISLSGVYGGAADPLPTLQLFDKQIQIRQGQANVKRWVDEILPLLTDSDPLGVESFATHHLPLEEAPEAYETFQKKEDGMIKVVFTP